MIENKEVLTKVTMTVKETADYIGISRGTVYNMVKANQIPHVKIGGKILFHRETIDKWLTTPTAK
ncbi:helix-turn-helix domain-containing protein [Lysinibacillus sp. NPDC096418]|uniref:helix-turn-helix domain-containing protein n=1 Tax=Lysinibacillus sp. NPDC096418 TaxID=3364138 RepID=UPI0037FF949D